MLNSLYLICHIAPVRISAYSYILTPHQYSLGDRGLEQRCIRNLVLDRIVHWDAGTAPVEDDPLAVAAVEGLHFDSRSRPRRSFGSPRSSSQPEFCDLFSSLSLQLAKPTRCCRDVVWRNSLKSSPKDNISIVTYYRRGVLFHR